MKKKTDPRLSKMADALELRAVRPNTRTTYLVGQSVAQSRAGKQGNCYLRALMVQAAWALWRTADRSDPLRQWVDAVSERRGKRVAVIALARRLSGVMWAMWRDGTVYEPARLATRQARGVRQHAQSLEYRAAALEAAAPKLSYATTSSTLEVATT
jgi:hypothetical protein